MPNPTPETLRERLRELRFQGFGEKDGKKWHSVWCLAEEDIDAILAEVREELPQKRRLEQIANLDHDIRYMALGELMVIDKLEERIK